MKVYSKGVKKVRIILSEFFKELRATFPVFWNIRHFLYYKSKRNENPPIFIVGCGHSGTSILLAVLGVHSKIFAVPEETNLAYQGFVKQMVRRFDYLAISQKKMRWVEKTPRHIHRIRELLTLLPNCKVILILRDGRDVSCSIQDRTGNLEEGIQRWVNDNRAGQSFWDHPKVFILRYEKLIEDFEEAMTEVLRFLGEDFERQMLRHHETPKLFYGKSFEKPPNSFGIYHEQYRNWQINQPLFDGRGKWKRLSKEEKHLIKSIAGDMLIEYGYAKDNEW